MADEPSRVEEVLELPSHLFRVKIACSLDIGGSLIKVGYTTLPDDVTVRFHFVSFPRDQLDQALNLVINNCKDFDRTKPVITCGIGCHQFEKRIEENLNTKISNELEMDPTVRGFRYLVKHIGADKAVYPKSSKAKEYVADLMKEFYLLAMKTKEDPTVDMQPDFIPTEEASHEGMPDDTPGEDESVLLVLMGSATAILKVNPDGSSQMVDGLSRSGLSFLGMGSLMTGAKTYEELMDLAKRGDQSNIDTQGRHLKKGCSGNDIYSAMPDNYMFFHFGNTAFKNPEDFSREDIAAALLAGICSDTVHKIHTRAFIRKTQHVYFAGSLTASSDVARYYIDREATLVNAMNDEKYKVNFQFLRYGAYLGVFGCLIKSLEPITI